MEYWSNSLCVPYIAAELSDDVFMIRTHCAACRETVYMWNMVCISYTPLRHKESLLQAWGCILVKPNQSSNWTWRTAVKTTCPLPPHCVEDSRSTFLDKVTFFCSNSILQVWCKLKPAEQTFSSLRSLCSLPTVGDDVCLREWLMNLLLVQHYFWRWA